VDTQRATPLQSGFLYAADYQINNLANRFTFQQVEVIPTWLANIGPSSLIHCSVAAERLAINRRLFVGDLTCDPIRKSQTAFRAGAGVTAGERVMPNAFQLCVFKCEF